MALPAETCDGKTNCSRLSKLDGSSSASIHLYLPWVAKGLRLIDEATLPVPDARLAQANAAAEALEKA